jgi:hypothetical protein
MDRCQIPFKSPQFPDSFCRSRALSFGVLGFRPPASFPRHPLHLGRAAGGLFLFLLV